MRTTWQIMSIILIYLYVCSCADRAEQRKVDKDLVTDTTAGKQGVPLDNIHRSRPADTLQSQDQSTNGVPLDNLHRKETTK